MTTELILTYLLGAILVTLLVTPFVKYYFLTRPAPLVTLTALPEQVLADLDSRIERFVQTTIETKLMYNIIRSAGNSTRPNMANSTILKEEFLESTVAETSASIIDSLSPQYLALLSTALPEDKIEDYILERVYLRIFNFSKDYNFEVLGITRRSLEAVEKATEEVNSTPSE